jgi:uncharacterized membrane protein YqaE (UPF0057 family)
MTKEFMTKKYRFGIWNIIGHVIIALFAGTLLFYSILIRPIQVGDSHGLTGGKHTVFSIILTYLVGFAVLIYAVYETIAMIIAIRKSKRDKSSASDTND